MLVPHQHDIDGVLGAAPIIIETSSILEVSQVKNRNIQQGLYLLRKPNIRKLFIAYLISYTGTAMAPIAMAFGVLELTGSTKESGMVIAAPTLASIVVLLFGGVLADRTSRQRIMASAEFLAMLSQLGIALLFLTGLAMAPALVVLGLISGIAIALNIPAATGLVTQLAQKDELQALNALLGIARDGAVTGGAALGGLVVAMFGAGIALMLDALSFGVSALLVISLKPSRQTAPEAASFVHDLKLGWKEFTSHTWLWVIVLQFAFVVAAFESVIGLLGPAVARNQMGGAASWGIIAAGLGAGTLVGGLLAMKVSVRYPMRFATYCVFVLAGIPLTLAVPLSVTTVAFTAFIAGISTQIFAVIWYTTLQTKVPAHMLSRVSAYDHLGSIALAPPGIVAAGFLFEEIGAQATLNLAALAIILPTLLVLCVRDVRMMTIDEVSERGSHGGPD